MILNLFVCAGATHGDRGGGVGGRAGDPGQRVRGHAPLDRPVVAGYAGAARRGAVSRVGHRLMLQDTLWLSR